MNATRRRVIAALALDRLDQDRRDLRRRDDRRQQRLQDGHARARRGLLVASELDTPAGYGAK